jgi:hypothetical protein
MSTREWRRVLQMTSSGEVLSEHTRDLHKKKGSLRLVKGLCGCGHILTIGKTFRICLWSVAIDNSPVL